jgi:hypothetical protein
MVFFIMLLDKLARPLGGGNQVCSITFGSVEDQVGWSCSVLRMYRSDR